MAHEPAAADGLPDTARAVDMRRTYPAGRILHLVPASAAFLGSGESHLCTRLLRCLASSSSGVCTFLAVRSRMAAHQLLRRGR